MKNSLQVAGGVGAIIGFVATLLLLELVGFGNRADPIMSSVLALLVFAPCGAIGGLLLGTALARRLRGGLSAKAPHTPEFGVWQANRDGSEIRYRARWPGQN